MNTADLKVHPLVADLFPAMADAAFEELVVDIEANGQNEPVMLYEGHILDGFHRYRACQRLGIVPNFGIYQGEYPLAYVISANLRRRQLSDDQRADVAAKLVTRKRGENQHSPNGGTSAAEAAEQMNVSKRAVERACAVRDHGSPELKEARKSGEVSLSTAAEVASLPEDQQREVLADGPEAVVAKLKELREERAAAAAAERKWEEVKDDDDDNDDQEADQDAADQAAEDALDDEAEPEADLTEDELNAIADAKPPNWKYWSRIFGAEHARRIKRTCLNKEGEVRALHALDWDTAKELIAAAERGETVSAVAVRDKLENEAKQLAAKFFDRDPEEARQLHAILDSYFTREAFMDALVVKIEWSNGNIYDPDTGCVRPRESAA